MDQSIEEILAAYRAVGKEVVAIEPDDPKQPTGATFSLSTGETEFRRIRDCNTAECRGTIFGVQAAIKARPIIERQIRRQAIAEELRRQRKNLN